MSRTYFSGPTGVFALINTIQASFCYSNVENPTGKDASMKLRTLTGGIKKEQVKGEDGLR